MDGAIQFNGIIGAFLIIATPIIMAAIALISLIVYLARRKSAQNELRWSKSFFLSALMFLTFDGIVVLFLFSQSTKTLSRDEAIAFDNRMLFGWVPVHIIGYFLLAAAIRFLHFRREPINKFVDKLR